MNTASAIYLMLSGVLGYVSYLAVLHLTKQLVTEKTVQTAKFVVQSSLMLGLLGTYIGFYVGTKDGLTAESAVVAIGTAVPTSIMGVITFLIGSAILAFITQGESYE
jgi:hypothetical protein